MGASSLTLRIRALRFLETKDVLMPRDVAAVADVKVVLPPPDSRVATRALARWLVLP